MTPTFQNISKILILEQGLGLVSQLHFVYDFSRNIFLWYSINWPNFIVWLPSLREILGSMCIVIICFPVYDVINLEIVCSFLIKSSFYIIKSQDRFKYEQIEISLEQKEFYYYLLQSGALIKHSVTKSKNKGVDSKQNVWFEYYFLIFVNLLSNNVRLNPGSSQFDSSQNLLLNFDHLALQNSCLSLNVCSIPEQTTMRS